MTVTAHQPAPVPNRPLNALDIADGAFAILQSKPRTVVAITAAFVLPAELLTAWLNRELFVDFDFGSFDAGTGGFEGQEPPSVVDVFSQSWIATLISLLVLPFLGVALTHLVSGWRHGVDRSSKDCVIFTLRRVHVIVAAFVIAKLAQAFTLLLATPVLILVAPILAEEGRGPIAAVTRSFRLGKRRYWQIVLLLLLIILVNLLLSNALLTLPTLGALLFGDWGWIVFFALGSLGNMVLTLLGVGTAVLVYFDVRDRTEGADITQRIQEARV